MQSRSIVAVNTVCGRIIVIGAGGGVRFYRYLRHRFGSSGSECRMHCSLNRTEN